MQISRPGQAKKQFKRDLITLGKFDSVFFGSFLSGEVGNFRKSQKVGKESPVDITVITFSPDFLSSGFDRAWASSPLSLKEVKMISILRTDI